MKTLLILLLLSTPTYSMSFTDQLLMESRIQNQLRQQQSLSDFEQSLKMQDLERKLKRLEEQQDSDVDGAALLLWIIQNRPDLLRAK